MRIPARPPDPDAFFRKLTPALNFFKRIAQANISPTVGGRYIHWDKLRHLPPPADLSHEEWWLALKMQREGLARPVPLRDRDGTSFTYSIVDPLPESLHMIDLSAGGNVQMPEPVTNPDTRDRYIVRSLIEEAITSSQLEGAATTREVAKEMIRQGRAPRDRSEKMILNNYRTMQRIESLRGELLSRDLVFEIHRMVTMDTLDDPSAAGRFRRPDERVVVSDTTGETLHEPPSADQLDARMESMCDFANGGASPEFIHPVIRSMILHFWLAYDHPFVDGNGRTARALFYWSMLHLNYWLCEFISISEIILKAPVKYGRAFLYTETDDNDLTYFLVYHSEVIRRAVDELHRYVERRSRQLRAVEAELRGMGMLNHRQRDLIGHALRHPGHRYTIESHKTSHSVVYQTARSDLLDLVDRGLLNQKKQGKVLVFTPVDDLERRLRQSG